MDLVTVPLLEIRHPDIEAIDVVDVVQLVARSRRGRITRAMGETPRMMDANLVCQFGHRHTVRSAILWP